MTFSDPEGSRSLAEFSEAEYLKIDERQIFLVKYKVILHIVDILRCDAGRL